MKLETRNAQENMDLVSSERQTKEWRASQSWYDGGKRNECEKFQRRLVESITGMKCPPTHERIHMKTNMIKEMTRPLLESDGFEWTENFDGVQMRDDGSLFYYNLKMICSDGGAQTRSLREVYHFISAQQKCVDATRYFINILDGDTCFKHRNHFQQFMSGKRIFIGDMKEFAVWYREVFLQIGQFYTTRYDRILTGLCIPAGISKIVEPFAGRGDLLKFLDADKKYDMECYDIDPKQDWIVKRDVLSDPPDYRDKFILTNPPYLSRNKSVNKAMFDKYKTNDLYKCFLIELVRQRPSGGIIIIPLNFWCSSRTSDVELRGRFLEAFRVEQLNIFEEQVFDDTSYTVCSFLFTLSDASDNDGHYLPITIYPSEKRMDVLLFPETDYLIGGEMNHLPFDGRYSVSRLLDTIVDGTTRLLLKCVDDDKPNIGLRMLRDDEDLFFDKTPKQSERSYATLVIQPPLTLEQQSDLATRFNEFLNEKRREYHSLFLNNFREFGRKRITFTLAYSIVLHLLSSP